VPEPYADERRFKRCRLGEPLLVRRPKGQTISGQANDVSEGGMGATLAGELVLKEMASILIAFRNEVRILRCNAILRYRDGTKFGFEFLDLSGSQREFIREFCKERSPQHKT
jgi:c-di-GMP-binding flagellar brake protein YcgR